MEQIIERLKEQKLETSKRYHDQGKDDGLRWAQDAEYEDLLYAQELGAIHINPGYDPTRDEVLGDYFADVIQDLADSMPGNRIPDGRFMAWQHGWIEGVREFWDQVKDKI